MARLKMRKIYDDKINIDKKTWIEILGNDKITDQRTYDILDVLFHSERFTERGGIIAKKLNINHHSALNGIIKSFSLRIINNYNNINYPKNENGKAIRFHIPFLGEKKGKYFYWTLRPELKDAINERYESIKIKEEK